MHAHATSSSSRSSSSSRRGRRLTGGYGETVDMHSLKGHISNFSHALLHLLLLLSVVCPCC